VTRVRRDAYASETNIVSIIKNNPGVTGSALLTKVRDVNPNRAYSTIFADIASLRKQNRIKRVGTKSNYRYYTNP
jgi:hypothetical protein